MPSLPKLRSGYYSNVCRTHWRHSTVANTTDGLPKQLYEDNTQAETRALALAVTAFAKDIPEMHIYSDSMATIQTITKAEKPHKDIVTLEVVSLACETFAANKDKIHIHHVYSHTTDQAKNENEKELQKTRANLNQARFGEETERITQGNRQADEQAKIATSSANRQCAMDE